MGRKEPKTLKVYFYEGDVCTPALSDVGSPEHGWMMTLLGFLKEIAKGHGSSQRKWRGNTYWSASLDEHEQYVFHTWLGWHSQYEVVESMDELFTKPVDTVDLPAVKVAG